MSTSAAVAVRGRLHCPPKCTILRILRFILDRLLRVTVSHRIILFLCVDKYCTYYAKLPM